MIYILIFTPVMWAVFGMICTVAINNTSPWSRQDLGIVIIWPLFIAKFLLRLPRFAVGGVKQAMASLREF